MLCSKNCIRRGDEKVCGCPEGKSRCKDRCVNLDINENHCGRCGNRCDQGEECMHGECQGGGCRPSGGTPTERDCTCAFTCGADPSQFTCQEENPNCQCTLTIEGFGFCADDPSLGDCATLPECSSSSDCEGRSECVENPCCRDTPACFPPCCRPSPFFCSADSECCSGHCVNETCTQGCQNASECPTPPFFPCQQATCTNGVCGVETAPDGTPCDADNNTCTIDVCRAGECVATGEVCL